MRLIKSLSIVGGAAFIGLAGPALANTFTVVQALQPANIGGFVGTLGVDLATPFTMDIGDTVDLTFTFDPVTLTGDSFIWALSFANDFGANMNVSGTVEFLGASGDLRTGPIPVNDLNSAAHIGMFNNASLYRTGNGAITFSGIRQILKIDSGESFDEFGNLGPFVPRTFLNARVWTDGVIGTGGGGGGGGGGNPGVIPEPATWAMMIAGFGLVGGVMRRRRDALTA